MLLILTRLRIEVNSSEQPPDFGYAERVIDLPLHVTFGNVGISHVTNLEPIDTVIVEPESGCENLINESIRARWECKRYRVFMNVRVLDTHRYFGRKCND